MKASELNKSLVREAFRPWEEGDSSRFFDLIADDVHWTVIGTTPASGEYRSKQALIQNAFGPLMDRIEGALTTGFVDLIAEGNKVVLRFTSSGITYDGTHYDQTYCFAMTMRDRRIVEIVAYIDTDLLRRVLE